MASANVWCHSDPDWQLSDWPQAGSCHLGPVVAPNPVSQCAIARMATTGNCQSGARVAKICCVYVHTIADQERIFESQYKGTKVDFVAPVKHLTSSLLMNDILKF